MCNIVRVSWLALASSAKDGSSTGVSSIAIEDRLPEFTNTTVRADTNWSGSSILKLGLAVDINSKVLREHLTSEERMSQAVSADFRCPSTLIVTYRRCWECSIRTCVQKESWHLNITLGWFFSELKIKLILWKDPIKTPGRGLLKYDLDRAVPLRLEK